MALSHRDFSPDVSNAHHPSLLVLASKYTFIDVSYLRWLWWPVLLYLFWSMAYVCDEYFVGTINMISERFQIPDDVAGATLMALGCNGPEMALNTISIFHPSAIGVGAVVGGEVFNVLVVIGAAILATPDEYMPLHLGFTFFRDVTFYLVSLAVLYWVLKNGEVSRANAAVLVLGFVAYTATVAYSSRLHRLLFGDPQLGMELRPVEPSAASVGSVTGAVAAVEVPAVKAAKEQHLRAISHHSRRAGPLETVIEWLQYPVKVCVAWTIPDMSDPKVKHLYPVSFAMSMAWLAMIAYSVVKACDGIHEDFGISTTLLGFTVAAAGTSFPNVFSGMCVARQGKTSMAIANALGANVQNVFLALAVPWGVQSFFVSRGPFPILVDNLTVALLECVITLLPVLLVVVCSSFTMPRWSGWFFFLIYAVYLCFALSSRQ